MLNNILIFILVKHFDGTVTRIQAIILIVHDLKIAVPDHIPPPIAKQLNGLKLPNIDDLSISILNKKKPQKEAILADSWKLLTVKGILKEFKLLQENVLIPAFQRALEITYFEMIHWKTRIKKIAGMNKIHVIILESFLYFYLVEFELQEADKPNFANIDTM